MDNEQMQMVLSYMIEKMDAQSQDEIKEILGGTLPDLGEDGLMKGGRAWDRLPARIKRRAALRTKQKDEVAQALGQDGKPETDDERRKRMFPHMDRLKVL